MSFILYNHQTSDLPSSPNYLPPTNTTSSALLPLTLCSDAGRKGCFERNRRRGSSYVQISIFGSNSVLENLLFLGGHVFFNTKSLELQVELK